VAEPADAVKDPLTEALKAIRAEYGHQSVVRGVSSQLLARRSPPSDPLPPWWPDRLSEGLKVVELAGPRSCGKLSLALLWLAAIRKGGLIAVINDGRQFYPPAAAAAGLDLERLIVVRPPGHREAADAAVLLAGCAGFDAILWPMSRQTRPSAMMAQKLGHAAHRGRTSILSLMERPAHTDWSGLASADVRLSVSRHQWAWEDGGLVGSDLDVACERARGIKAGDWSFSLRRVSKADDPSLHGSAVRIASSGTRLGAVPAGERNVIERLAV
jgi:hypothetical protein